MIDISLKRDPSMTDAVYKAFFYYVSNDEGFQGSFRKPTIYSARNPLRVGYDDDGI